MMGQKKDTADVATFSHRLDLVGEDLRTVCRLLGKPGVCMAAPEVLDTVRMALEGLNARMADMANEMRAADV